MPEQRIIRVSRDGKSSTPCLISVTQSGRSNVDFKFEATEGEHVFAGTSKCPLRGGRLYLSQLQVPLFGPPTAPFVLSVNNFRQVKKSELQTLRSSSYKGSEEEWESIFTSSLLRRPIAKDHLAALDNLEFFAKVASDASNLELIWRHKARTTTVRYCPTRLEPIS
jgi:hypothetical protein